MAEGGITRAEMARRVGVTEAAIRHRISEGHITPRPDGLLNPADADVLRAQRQVREAGDPRSAKLLKARVLGGAVKTRRLNLTLQEARGRSVERAELEAALRNRARTITKRLASWPERYAADIAEALGSDLQTASEILKRFTDIALAEVGDLEAEAMRAIDPGD